jgi:fatty acid desaturase
MRTLSTKTEQFSLSKGQRIMELLRPWLLLGLYIFFAAEDWWWLAIPTAAAAGLAAFVQMHDCIHNSLGLSKKANDRLLSISALLLLKSGHCLQVTHLRHHAQCLSDKDPEGEPARWSFSKVLLNGPYHIFALRLHSLKMAPNSRGIQLMETGLTLLLLLIFIALFYFFGNAIGLVYWAVIFVLSASMPVWASYIPHHLASRNPVRLAGARMARIWTPVVSSFAFHHVHHAYPKVPTALLAKAAQELPEPEEEDHHR